MHTIDSQSDEKERIKSESENDQSQADERSVGSPIYRDLTLTDFLPLPTKSSTTVDDLNDFFNSTKIKQELHWFTHRDTLVRALDRHDRELFHIRPQGKILAAAMIWCESRVLESDQAQIRLIATRPDYRDHGFARMLVNECISFAQSWDKTEMIADVAEEAPATEFWLVNEFDITGTRITDSGREMLRMSREI